MNATDLVRYFENAWDVGGFLHQARQGMFDSRQGEDFLNALRSVSIEDSEMVPKRLLSLLWMLAVFLEWQTKSVASVGGNVKEYERFVNEVETVLQDVIGVP